MRLCQQINIFFNFSLWMLGAGEGKLNWRKCSSVDSKSQNPTLITTVRVLSHGTSAGCLCQHSSWQKATNQHLEALSQFQVFLLSCHSFFPLLFPTFPDSCPASSFIYSFSLSSVLECYFTCLLEGKVQGLGSICQITATNLIGGIWAWWWEPAAPAVCQHAFWTKTPQKAFN